MEDGFFGELIVEFFLLLHLVMEFIKLCESFFSFEGELSGSDPDDIAL